MKINNNKLRLLISLAITPLSFGGAAHASCAAAFCTVNSNWDGFSEPGWGLDLRYEYVDQDQLRAGRDKVSADEVDRHEEEISTVNRNVIAAIQYNVNSTWGVSVQAPFLDREHTHVEHHEDEHGEEAITESWDFRDIGDVRVLGHYNLSAAPEETGRWVVNAGLKLPTGATDKTNSEGGLAERTLQLGTGTTDAIVGAAYQELGLVANRPFAWFVQGQLQLPVTEHDDYKPGEQLSLDGGVNYAYTNHLNTLLQLNLLVRERDSGSEAEPEDSGGVFAFLSPGLAYSVTQRISIYGFVQLPLYQRVNGVQLTADHSIAVGVRYRPAHQ